MLPSELRPTTHTFIPDPLEPLNCATCGCPENFGGLHPAPDFEPVPDAPGYTDGDVVYGEVSGDVFRVRQTRYDGLVFIPLGQWMEGQKAAPKGAVLLVREGVPVADLGDLGRFSVRSVTGVEQ